MITNDNLMGIYLHLSFMISALCAAFYFEIPFIEFENSGDFGSIGAFVLYPMISYFSRKFSGNFLIQKLEEHNQLKSIIFMAAGYRIAFIHMSDRRRNILLITKYIWKIIIYLAFPLGLKSIADKIIKAFYEGEKDKNVKNIKFQVY